MVAIVGRPNVGKSTLFNRLIGRKRAIVEDSPGVTRDRHYADIEWAGKAITLVDTGGFLPDDSSETSLARSIRQQAQAAVEECDVVLFVVDGREGRGGGDEEIAEYLRRSKRPTLLVVNKVDDFRKADAVVADFHRLGLGDPWPVSAEHGHGSHDVLDAATAALPESAIAEVSEVPDDRIRVAIVGRPNVGKSTLLNALLGEERVIASDVAGTTRDPIDVEIEHKGQRFVLVDTAGIRRKATIAHKVEQFSVLASLRAIEDADVVVLLLDASEAAVDQDARIAGVAEAKGRPLIVAINKWDQMRGKMKEPDFREGLKYELDWVAYAPVMFMSAKEGDRVEKVLELAKEVHRQAHVKASTPLLNKLLKHVTTEHPLPFHNSRPLKIYYVAQVGTAPPAFAFMCNRPEGIPDRYKRYLINQLRKTFELKVPVRLFFRERPGANKRKAKLATIRGLKRKGKR